MGSATPSIAVCSFKIEQAKLDRFREVAAAHERSMAQELRWMIDQAIQKLDGQENAA